MTVSFHPEFPQDVKKYQSQYREISPQLGLRFRGEIEAAIEAIKASPGSAGHFLNTSSKIVRNVRRRNLRAFPFFVLYGHTTDALVFRSVLPSASDPLTWLHRLLEK